MKNTITIDSRTINDLEFQKVLDIVALYAGTIHGKERIYALRPISDINEIKIIFNKITQFQKLLNIEPDYQIPAVEDIRPLLERAKINGSILKPVELLSVAGTLQSCMSVKSSLLKHRTTMSLICDEAENIDDFSEFIRNIHKCITHGAEIKDNASPELSLVRRQQREIRNRIIQKLEGILRKLDRNAIDSELISIREGRYVIPVRYDFKGHVKGLIIDFSNSRTTAFIEPFSVVEWNNDLRSMQIREKDEIERICKRLTGAITILYNEIKQTLLIIAEIDSLCARAIFCNKTKGTCPQLNTGYYCKINRGRHPLLAHKTSKVISQSLHLSPDTKGMLLTGPNAGGKTVCLKMIGLLHLMGLSGIPVPADEGTSIHSYKKIFADIGDLQSIENSLSTFSAHISRLYDMLKKADAQTLILIDELGTGTDPVEGASLAIAILESLMNKNARFIATTHLNDLKIFGDNKPNLINARMEFNENSYQPAFILRTGIPGKSYAFEIAQHLGIDQTIIEHARKYSGTVSQLYENAVTRYQQLIKSAEDREKTIKEKLMQAEEREKKIEKREKDIRQWQDIFKNKILKEKQQYMEQLKKNFLEEIRKITNTGATSESHKFLSQIHKEHNQLIKDRLTVSDSAVSEKFSEGQIVRFKVNSMRGEVVKELGKQRYLISVGNIKIEAHARELSSVKDKHSKPTGQISTIEYEIDNDISPQCDIRGLKSEEAITALDKYIDSLRLSSLTRALIIHGKGTGKLRESVAEYLANCPGIKKVSLAEQHEGGTGATVIELD